MELSESEVPHFSQDSCNVIVWECESMRVWEYERCWQPSNPTLTGKYSWALQPTSPHLTSSSRSSSSSSSSSMTPSWSCRTLVSEQRTRQWVEDGVGPGPSNKYLWCCHLDHQAPEKDNQPRAADLESSQSVSGCIGGKGGACDTFLLWSAWHDV